MTVPRPEKSRRQPPKGLRRQSQIATTDSDADQLSELRLEITQQHELLDEIRTLRYHIGQGESVDQASTAEIIQPPQAVEGVASHTVSTDTNTTPPETFRQTNEGLKHPTLKRPRRSVAGLPSVRSLRGDTAAVPKERRPHRQTLTRFKNVASKTSKQTPTRIEDNQGVQLAEKPKRTAPAAQAKPTSERSPEPSVIPVPVHRPLLQEAELSSSMDLVVTQSVAPAEITVNSKWWSVSALTLCLLPVLAGYLWISLENLNAGLTLTDLQSVTQRKGNEKTAIRSAVARKTEGVLARFDSRRDYLVAQALNKLDPNNVEPVRKNLERAIERAPANVWNRLTLAKLDDVELETTGETSTHWDAVRRLSSSEAAYWSMMGKHWCDQQESVKAVAAYRKYLIHHPEATGEALRNLASSTVETEEALRAIPASAIAALQAAKFLQEQRDPDWRKRTEVLLTKIAKDESKRSAEDFAAEAELCLLLERTEDAVRGLTNAIQRKPGQQDWKLRLARLHYSAERFAECDKLALQVISSSPGSDHADQARLLREKIELVTGGGPVSAN